VSGSAEPPRTPRLPREITHRLRDLTLHRDTLLYALSEFGDDFSRDRFVAAATSKDPAERAKVLAVERGFEILMNYLTELTVAGLEAAGYRNPGPEVVAPREFRLLHSKGGISSDLCRRLIELNRTRNDLQHDYPTMQAHLLHAAVSDLLAQFAAFMRTYPGWLREHVPQGAPD
jgi:uncharacterized protein YutE (UPF0331/DUF86 family)